MITKSNDFDLLLTQENCLNVTYFCEKYKVINEIESKYLDPILYNKVGLTFDCNVNYL
ncbi:protein of unknown function [Candidatus Nitrosocosmicus franklandus]|uniref:Uncharacterized protein n=1 Tax=Candidatus Nitrosocosmicus franklandianus TaxID=1798806 RepID=A0A484ICJ7_9ARCH|nr:protein of unknown function [Candidatus Nitrosocosmicus franklandus]